jgi:anaerobic magnesium-protoporphyrin IX monomethyl ester cyclase
MALNTNNNKVLLFNPRSADHNHRLPISILQVGASISGKYEFCFVDGNLESDPWGKITHYLNTGEFMFFAVTVMPGPQLKQAVLYTRAIREKFPSMIIIWGGYFASNHTEVSMNSGYIDYIIRGPGDLAFPELLDSLADGKKNQLDKLRNLAFRKADGTIVINEMDEIPDQDLLVPLPLINLEKFYPVERYIVKTFIGNRTLLYHSSIGCPYNCSFCGVGAIYGSGWRGKSAKRIFAEIIAYKNTYGIDSVEILDSNFFASRPRILEFCSEMKGQGISWWAEGRVDTLNNYSDAELNLIKESGCRLVFMGAESGNDALLGKINKGGTLSRQITMELVTRFGHTGIIPQLSFVLGFPADNPKAADRQVRDDIGFIRKLKKINRETEIILYLFSPVPAYQSELYRSSVLNGFSFPSSLGEWLQPRWQDFDLRRGMITPWLMKKTVRYIAGFETVLLAAFPGISNFHLSRAAKYFLRLSATIRYRLRLYCFPVELKALLKIFAYQRPEKEGFYSE